MLHCGFTNFLWEKPLETNNFQGFPRISTDFHGFRRISTVFEGFPRISKDFEGFPRISKDFHGFRRISKDFQAFPDAARGEDRSDGSELQVAIIDFDHADPVGIPRARFPG